VLSAVPTVVRVISDLIAWVGIEFRQRKSLQAEVLFLRRQLALYVERGVKTQAD
jgi:putative transposase